MLFCSIIITFLDDLIVLGVDDENGEGRGPI